MSLGLTRPPLADSTMLTLTSHYTATNAKHHRYAATNLPTVADEDAPSAAQIGAPGRRYVGRAGRPGHGCVGRAGRPGHGTSAGLGGRETGASAGRGGQE